MLADRNARSTGLGKGIPSAAARKSGASIGETRTARKTGSQRLSNAQDGAYKSEDENTSPARSTAIKSSSGTTPSLTGLPSSPSSSSSKVAVPGMGKGKLAAPSIAYSNTTTSTDDSGPLPLVQSRRGGKDNIAYHIPPGANRPGLGKGKGGKAHPQFTSSGKRKAAPSDSIEEEEEEEQRDDDDTEDSLNVRSRSPRGYTWEVEVLELKPEDVKNRISYHNSITTTIEREGKNERVRFRRGDKIWILPDPQTLPPVSHEVEINELSDDDWWVGEILDCCTLDQDTQTGESLGLLRIAWYYAPDHAYGLDDLHSNWKKKVRKYRFDDPERIKSDHVDFIGIECFAGFADGIYTFLNISGLEVDDVERMKPKHRRQKSKRIVRMTGFTLKEAAKRQADREANLERNPGIARRIRPGQRKAARSQLSQVDNYDEDEKDASD